MSEFKITGPGKYLQRDGGVATVAAVDNYGRAWGTCDASQPRVWTSDGKAAGTDQPYDLVALRLESLKIVTKQVWLKQDQLGRQYVSERPRDTRAGVIDVARLLAGPVDVTFAVPEPLAPKKHRVQFWVNVYSGEGPYPTHDSRESADKCADKGRVACIEVDREIAEGEGLP